MSLLAPLPSSLSDRQFIGDLANLLERRKLKCGADESLDRFASELVSSDALRSDLFALCSAISHLSAEDLSSDQLLLLVARALHGTAEGGDFAGEIPAPVRSTFQEAYEQWSSSRAAVANESASWPDSRAAAMFDAEVAAARTSVNAPNAVDVAEAGDGVPTIQAALGAARKRMPEDDIFPALVAEPAANAASEQTDRPAELRVWLAGEPHAEAKRPRLGVRFSLRAAMLGAVLLGLAAGFAAGCVFETVRLHRGRVPDHKAVLPADPTHLASPPLRDSSATDKPGDIPQSAVNSAAAKKSAKSAAAKLALPVAQQSLLSRVERQAGTRYQGIDAAPPANVPGPVRSDVADLTSQLGATPHLRSPDAMAYAEFAPTPVYPSDVARGISGTVTVEISISRQGSVTGAWALSGPEELRPAVLRAVQEWQFRPYVVDGEPTAFTTTLGFFFNGR